MSPLLVIVSWQGTSDPVVYVEAFGQKFATEVKQACLSCVFDETFVISLRNLDKDLFEEGVIRCVLSSRLGRPGAANRWRRKPLRRG